jgi:hypothetical protein
MSAMHGRPSDPDDLFSIRNEEGYDLEEYEEEYADDEELDLDDELDEDAEDEWEDEFDDYEEDDQEDTVRKRRTDEWE